MTYYLFTQQRIVRSSGKGSASTTENAGWPQEIPGERVKCLTHYTSYQKAGQARGAGRRLLQDRTDNMAVTGVSSQFPSNHVSHSFAQHVAFDGSLPVYADHGDAYPRAFVLNVEDAQGQSAEHVVLPFSGAIGDNTTNAIPGGLGVSADNYLFAGASSPQKGNDSPKYCNAFLAVTSKDSGKSDIKWLTSFPADGREYVSAVKLVQLNNNTFVVMWQTEKVVAGQSFHGFGDFRYAVFDGTGKQIGQTTTVEGYLAPVTDPTVEGGRISWVRPGKGDLTTGIVEKSPYLRLYTLDIDLNSPTSQSGVSVTMSPETLTLGVGQKESLKVAASGGGISSSPAVTYQSSDWLLPAWKRTAPSPSHRRTSP